MIWWRSKRAVAGAVGATLVLLMVAWSVRDRTAETPAGSSNRARATGETAPPEAPVVDLKLERLEGDGGELVEADRDPFRFRPKPPPPPPPRAAASSAPRPPEFTAAPPPGPPPVPAIPVKYMGVVTVGGQRVAAFIDARGLVFSGKEGDIIEGQYRVLRIGLDAVELAYLDGRGRQTIRLTGQ
jgi:hypothetical protein